MYQDINMTGLTYVRPDEFLHQYMHVLNILPSSSAPPLSQSFCRLETQNLFLQTRVTPHYTVSQKNVPPLTCNNLDIHNPITTIFGGRVTEKVKNQTMLCFPTTPI